MTVLADPSSRFLGRSKMPSPSAAERGGGSSARLCTSITAIFLSNPQVKPGIDGAPRTGDLSGMKHD